MANDKNKMAPDQLAASFISQARADRTGAPKILERAAATFVGLSKDPRNSASAQALRAYAREFAEQAHRETRRPATTDDFYDRLEETAQAYQEVGPDNDLGLVARRNEIHRNRVDERRVSIAPFSINESSTLGNLATIKYNPTPEERANRISQSNTVAFWQGNKQEAQAFTVDLQIVVPAFVPAGTVGLPSARPYVLIKYGSDGVTTEIDCDLAYGQRLTLVGNYVSVLVGMGKPQLGKISAQMTAGASIGMFAAPSQAPVLKTLFLDGLVGGATSVFLPRPNRAVLLRPLQWTAAPGQTAALVFYDVGQDPVYRQTITNSAANVPIELTDDVAFITVHNNAAGPENFRLPFQLSL